MNPTRHERQEKTTISSRLKNAREQAGLSQTKLAALVGCSRQFIIAIEKGRNLDMGAELAIAISDALQVPIRWLIRGDPLKTYVRLSREEETALIALRALTPALRKHFTDSLASLASIQATAADPFPAASKPPP